MAELKWIKIVTDIFESPKISLIESEKKSDEILIVWFKLLCLAGKLNNSGIISIASKPYTDEMIASAIRRKLPIVQKSLSIFKEYNMVEQINGAYAICNWAKHQSADRIEKENERMKNYMQSYRAKQKALCNANSNAIVSGADIDIEKDIEEEQKKKGEKKLPTGPLQLPIKHQHGEYKNVMLTDNEYTKLKAEISDTDAYIEDLSAYIESKGVSYKSHYAVIRKWKQKDVAEGKTRNGKSSVVAGRPDAKIDWLDGYMKNIDGRTS